MALLPILTGENNVILRSVAEPVERFDQELQKLIHDMQETMLSPTTAEHPGIGLAANQVGVLQRVMLVTFGLGEDRQRVVPMINPKILETSPKLTPQEEGCLSLPHAFGVVQRPLWVRAAWYSSAGERSEKKLKDWESRIFLHELDHLDGRLFIDHLSKKEREKLSRS